MKTIAFFGQKGGGSKSTMTVHEAVQAALDSMKVLVCDMDELQQSAVSWAARRQSETPTVLGVPSSALAQVLRKARADGFDLAILDSPPHASPAAMDIARAADLIIIPVKPSPFEMERAEASAKMARAAGKTPHFLLTRCDRRQKAQNDEAAGLLAKLGEVIPVRISQLAAYEHAISGGLSVAEFKNKSNAPAEVRALWEWIKEQLWPSQH
jgi:chromosome partitioning protein